MKKLILSFAVLLLPLGTMAATFVNESDYTLPSSSTVSEDLYVMGNHSIIEGTVIGDALIASNHAKVSGNITEDVDIIGGNIDIFTNRVRDVRAVGNRVVIGQSVFGNVAVFSKTAVIARHASICGNVDIFARNVRIDGTIDGDVIIHAHNVIISGTVNGALTVYSDGKITVTNTGVLNSHFIYHAPESASIGNESKINQEMVEFYPTYALSTNSERKVSSVFSVVGFIKWLTYIAIVVLLAKFFAHPLTSIARKISFHPVAETVRGGIIALLIPIAILLLVCTIVGVGLGLLGFVIYGLMLIVTQFVAGIIVGILIWKWALHSRKFMVNWQNAITGLIVLHLVMMIPFVGCVIWLLVYLATLGAMSYWAFTHVRK